MRAMGEELIREGLASAGDSVAKVPNANIRQTTQPARERARRLVWDALSARRLDALGLAQYTESVDHDQAYGEDAKRPEGVGPADRQ